MYQTTPLRPRNISDFGMRKLCMSTKDKLFRVATLVVAALLVISLTSEISNTQQRSSGLFSYESGVNLAGFPASHHRSEILASDDSTASAGGSSSSASHFPHIAQFLKAANAFHIHNSVSSPSIDEQIGLTFTQNFNSLAYNVTAIEQNDSADYGPAYLLNGLSNEGYWYQVGISWHWPYENGGYVNGFALNYEAFNPSGSSIFPSNGGGGIANFTGSINNGDTVLLNLYFSSGNVTFSAYDWNTSASASESYSAEGATLFAGLTNEFANSNGYFSGLMTEQYQANDYYGGEERVLYSDPATPVSSAWMWIDEFNATSRQLVFGGSTPSPVNYGSNPNRLHHYSLEGANAASNAYEFLTGTKPIVFLTFDYSTQDDSTPTVPPLLSYLSAGIPQFANLTNTPESYEMDYDSAWSLTGSVSANQAWFTNDTSGIAISNQTISALYYHVYNVTFDFNVLLGGTGYSSPWVQYSFEGLKSNTTAGSGKAVWADSESPYSFESDLAGSTNSSYERWLANFPSGNVTAGGNITATYFHQYYITISTGSSSLNNSSLVSPLSGWYNSSASISISEKNYTGWQPEGWSGSGEGSYSGSSSSATVNVSSPLSETAIYYPGLTISAESGGSVSYKFGSVSGTVTAGTTNTIYVPTGTSVSLSSNPSSFLYSFTGWEGGLGMSKSIEAQSIVINSPVILTAAFSYNYLVLSIIGAIAVIVALSVLMIILRSRRGA